MAITLAPFTAIDRGVRREFEVAAHSGLLAGALDTATALVAIFQKPSLHLVYLNSAGRRWLDPDGRATFVDYTLSDLIGVGSVEKLKNEILLQAAVQGKWNGACTLRDIWGSEINVQAGVTAYAGDAGQDDGFYCLQATLAANQEPASTSDHELLHALLETVPEAVYFKDLQSRFIRVSRALARKDGRAGPAELIGLTDFDRFTIEHAQLAFADEQRIIRTGEAVVDLEEKETWPDGRVTWVSTTNLPLRDRDGHVVGTFGISRDITAHKLAEQKNHELQIQLQLAQKLESIGRLAAGIAHEVNTPTQFITDNIHFVTEAFAGMTNVVQAFRRLSQAAAQQPALAAHVQAVVTAEREHELDYFLKEVPTTLQQSLDGLGRITRIVQSLKEFSHPNTAELAPADLNHVIETAVTVSRHEWKYVAEVVTDFDPMLPVVPCLVDEFNQVMLNLIINAAHAIESALKLRPGDPRRGTITIRTRAEADGVIVEVADTGTGISKEIRRRIFEPFFTTKEPGKGTGQGLAIVQNVIVNHHRGNVDFTSEVDVGTTFRLRLPLAPKLNATAT